MSKPLFSICIPAFKRVQYLKRLLDSIALQSFKDYEVVVTDDSPGEEVTELCNLYHGSMCIRVFKNKVNLNTPENWNEAIRRAKGKWIKIMHDDDWFSKSESLQQFAKAIEQHPDCSFFFSAYKNVYEETQRVMPVFIKPFWRKALNRDPNILIADNVIGPPSAILHKNDQRIWYDRQMKYVVDIDFYIRYLSNESPCYIPESLINVGINSAQVTKYTFNVPEVHLKESLYLLQKTGEKHLKNLIVFDGWWRLIRNFRIRSISNIRATGFDGNVPLAIIRIMNFQKNVPFRLLKKGVVSKLLMISCYMLHNRKITKII